MSETIILKKATRIEGNANIRIEIDDGRVKIARFLVHEFRGFEKFMHGRRIEFVPHLVSRICGLCSTAHQVASLKAIEDAFAVKVPLPVKALRDVLVLAEWISSHALSYFFLSMPDFIGAPGGIFELVENRPVIANEALDLRKAGQRIIEILGKRPVHPVGLGIGRFLTPPTVSDLSEVRKIANDTKERAARLISQIDKIQKHQKSIIFPSEQQINFLSYDDNADKGVFQVYNRNGDSLLQFNSQEFEDNISEIRADWTLTKFPYLTRFGFPSGIMLVGPLSRSFQSNGILKDEELSRFELTDLLRNRAAMSLDNYDACRLLEIFWAAKKILSLLDRIDLKDMSVDVNVKASGKGIGIVEAPRGVLIHNYLIKQGCIEKIELIVATQFNNAFINLLLRDLAEKHVDGNKLSEEGERLISRCIRIFDPCLSCATH